MDPYQILGISPNATDDEIKKAYRRLVKQYHPDKNSSPEAGGRVQLLNAAYEILTDPLKRAHYHQPTYADVIEEDDPIEAYKREFKRKRWEKEQAAKARALSRQKVAYKVLRTLTFPILLFALLIVLDGFLPFVPHEEIPIAGWQERERGGKYSKGALISYLQTPGFYVRVPHRFHLNYPYYDDLRPPVTIYTSAIFDVPRHVYSTFGGYNWRVEIPNTIHSHIFPIKWMLLLSSLFVVARKKFSHLDYVSCFLPALLLAGVIVIMM